MTNVFSIPSKNVYLDIDASEDDTLTLTVVHEEGKSESVKVDPADLARELITASPVFALAVGDLAKSAIVQFFKDEEDVELGLGIA
jgi:hypothetical protein